MHVTLVHSTILLVIILIFPRFPPLTSCSSSIRYSDRNKYRQRSPWHFEYDFYHSQPPSKRTWSNPPDSRNVIYIIESHSKKDFLQGHGLDTCSRETRRGEIRETNDPRKGKGTEYWHLTPIEPRLINSIRHEKTRKVAMTSLQIAVWSRSAAQFWMVNLCDC